MPFSQESRRAALVVAHPSHELCIHGWMQEAHPYVCVLTDGGGRSGQSRLGRTTEVLSRAGAIPGTIYGRLTDLEVYSAILRKDSDLFVTLVEELAQTFVDEQIDYVVGDSSEGYNVAHDMCRAIIDVAVELAAKMYGHHVTNFDFPLVGPPNEVQNGGTVWLQLDDATFEHKMEAARAYSKQLAEDVDLAIDGESFHGIRRLSEPQLNEAIDIELKSAVIEELESRPALKTKYRYLLEGLPLDALRVEYLRPVYNGRTTESTNDEPRFYELYGEKLVAAGRYKNVIRYRDHMYPLTEAIWKRV
jgi:hypothetical protein